MDTYYTFTKKQKKELPLEFCYFEKVLSRQLKTQKKKMPANMRRPDPFYKPIVIYTLLILLCNAL
jgi:hypothetical protein